MAFISYAVVFSGSWSLLMLISRFLLTILPIVEETFEDWSIISEKSSGYSSCSDPSEDMHSSTSSKFSGIFLATFVLYFLHELAF